MGGKTFGGSGGKGFLYMGGKTLGGKGNEWPNPFKGGSGDLGRSG
jgi:hypothetical protein